MENNIHYCNNCEHPLKKDYNYCPECGQKAKDELTLGVLFNNAVNNYFSVDARFFISFLPLLFRPGYLPQKFIEGKRLKYLHPAQFYLFISVVFFFILSFETRHQQQVFDKTMKDSLSDVTKLDSTDQKALDSLNMEKMKEALADKDLYADAFTQANMDSVLENASAEPKADFGWDIEKLDSLISIDAPLEEKIKVMGYKEGASQWKKRGYTQLLKIYERKGGGLLKAFYDTIPVAMFFLLPIFALLLKLLFFRRGRFAHHLVFSFYYFSFLFTVFAILLLANLIYPIPNWIDWLIIFITGVYLLLAIMRFYGQRFIKSFIKTFMLLFTYLLFVLPTSLLLLIIISFMIY